MNRFRLAAALLGAGLAGLAAAHPLAAQVGHPPAQSPYHDIAKGHTIYPLAGRMWGAGGRIGLGPHQGWSYGLRYDIRISNFTALTVTGIRANLGRNIARPDAPPASQLAGPVDQTVTLGEAGLQFSLTGQKSWHGLSPVLGIGAGLAFASRTPEDTTTYEFGNKLFFDPSAGLRFFVTPSVQLRADAGAVFWKLEYPRAYTREPSQAPGTAEQSHAVIAPGSKLTQWTPTPWLRLGIGVTFRP